MRTAFSLMILLGFAGVASAQAERYELGQRLKAFEKQWDKTTDAKLRKKALADLPKLTGLFFTNQFGEAGRTLDEARWILEGKQLTDDEKWAQSLFAVPESRYVTNPGSQFEVTVKAFYSVKTAQPKNLRIDLSIPGLIDVSRTALDKLPTKIDLKFTQPLPRNRPGGDFALQLAVRLGEATAAKSEIGVSFEEVRKDFVVDLAKRFESADAALKPKSLEWATARDRAGLLGDLSKGSIFETDIPAWALHQQVMEFQNLHQLKKEYFNRERTGQFWLSIPTGTTTTPARLFVPKVRGFIPKGEEVEKPLPLVVALHGAGGSENLFFEGYGDGQIVKLCEKRGWMLLAPRSGLSFVGGGPPVGEIVDELAKRYPIDPKAIFVVGHSMGAMQTIDAAQKYPGQFAGIAAFGGGGRVRKPELFAELPTFIGVGDQDFALAQSRALKKSLEDGKAKSVKFEEYEGLEHLLICREALPDAFAMFDKVLKK